MPLPDSLTLARPVFSTVGLRYRCVGLLIFFITQSERGLFISWIITKDYNRVSFLLPALRWAVISAHYLERDIVMSELQCGQVLRIHCGQIIVLLTVFLTFDFVFSINLIHKKRFIETLGHKTFET